MMAEKHSEKAAMPESRFQPWMNFPRHYIHHSLLFFLRKIDCSVSAGLKVSDFKNENVLRLRKKFVFGMLCVFYNISGTHNKNNFVNLNRVYIIT